MLKKLLLLSILLFISQVEINSQELVDGTIFYKKIFIENSTLKKNLKKEYSQIKNDLKNLDYILEFNEANSKFYYNPVLQNDFNNSLDRVIMMGRGNGSYYTNRNTSIHVVNFLDKEYLVTNDKKRPFKLINESKMIGKYLCYKAKRTEQIGLSKKFKKDIDIIAWYCPEISYSFGPIGYYNLPGLILELTVGNIKYIATDINIKEGKKSIKKPSQGITITNEEFDNLIKKAFDKIREN